MNELDNFEVEQLLDKIEKIREIVLSWKNGNDVETIKREISSLQILELDYYLSSISDEQTLMMVLSLYCYKLFAKVNVKIKKIINDYKNDSKRLLEIQNRIDYLAKSTADFNDKFFFDKNSEQAKKELEEKEQKGTDKKMN